MKLWLIPTHLSIVSLNIEESTHGIIQSVPFFFLHLVSFFSSLWVLYMLLSIENIFPHCYIRMVFHCLVYHNLCVHFDTDIRWILASSESLQMWCYGYLYSFKNTHMLSFGSYSIPIFSVRNIANELPLQLLNFMLPPVVFEDSNFFSSSPILVFSFCTFHLSHIFYPPLFSV